ncbi:hypothetical protein JCM15831A_06480 [Asaia astilbis]
MVARKQIVIGDQIPAPIRSIKMPLTFIYLIGIAICAVLAFIAPHYRNLAFVMTAIFSIQIIAVGLLEAYRESRLR